MKKTTLYEYSKTVALILAFCTVTSLFGMIRHFTEDLEIASSQGTLVEDIVIIIDAGHGGEDGGAVGVSGSLEKDLNLQISSYLKEMFSLTDITVVMTRTDDRLLYNDDESHRKKFFDLKNRVEAAKEYSNPLFLSIHQNKFPIPKYKGLQVYYSKNNRDSSTIAATIQKKTCEYLQRENSRKEKAAGKNIYLLDKLTCPAIIVECGFLSNPEEEQMLCNADYQKKIAFTIFSSVMDYISCGNIKT